MAKPSKATKKHLKQQAKKEKLAITKPKSGKLKGKDGNRPGQCTRRVGGGHRSLWHQLCRASLRVVPLPARSICQLRCRAGGEAVLSCQQWADLGAGAIPVRVLQVHHVQPKLSGQEAVVATDAQQQTVSESPRQAAQAQAARATPQIWT